MGFVSKILSIFQPVKRISVNQSPLQFSEEASLEIRKHLDNRPANVKSAFKISVLYQEDKILCQVGFDDYKMIRKTLFDYPIPLIISEQDEMFLRGACIDYHKEDEAYFYYPNVHLEVVDRRGEEVFVFYLNRNIIAPESAVSNYSLDVVSLNSSHPLFIQKIFNTQIVESIYLEKNFISIEKVKHISKEIFEKTLSDIILSYFETSGYPLLVTEAGIEVYRFAKY